VLASRADVSSETVSVTIDQPATSGADARRPPDAGERPSAEVETHDRIGVHAEFRSLLKDQATDIRIEGRLGKHGSVTVRGILGGFYGARGAGLTYRLYPFAEERLDNVFLSAGYCVGELNFSDVSGGFNGYHVGVGSRLLAGDLIAIDWLLGYGSRVRRLMGPATAVSLWRMDWLRSWQRASLSSHRMKSTVRTSNPGRC
jgi:hypothetical protein